MYKLVNIKTQKETLCQKIQIENFDYYVSDEKIKPNDYFYWYDSDGDSKYIWQCHSLTDNTHLHVKYNNNEFPFPDGDWNKCYAKKVIACNNPNINIPQVVDEVERLAEKEWGKSFATRKHRRGFIEGYNKSQETHPFSLEDMIEFGKFCDSRMLDSSGKLLGKTLQELLQLWKEQRTKIVYYNE